MPSIDFNLDPETRRALWQTGWTNAGNVARGLGEQQYSQYNNAVDRVNTARTARNTALQNALASQSNRFGAQRVEEDAGDRLAGQMLGTSPMDFQNQRANAARAQELFRQIDNGALAHLGVHAGPYGGGTNFATQFGPSPEAEQSWWEQRNMLARGRASKPNLGKIYEGTGSAIDESVENEGSNRYKEWAGSWDTFNKKQDAGWSQLYTLAEQDIQSAKTEEERSQKSSFWQKFMGVFSSVGPMLLSVLKLGGGTSSPNSDLWSPNASMPFFQGNKFSQYQPELGVDLSNSWDSQGGLGS